VKLGETPMRDRYEEEPEKNRVEIWKIAVPVGVMFLLIAASVFGPKDDAKDDAQAVQQEEPEQPMRDEGGTKTGAWVAAKDVVIQNLKSPSTAKFGWQNPEEIVTDLENRTFRVKAWVDSQNSFGATVRTKFVCDLAYLGNYQWKTVRFEFLE
jgi:hypothetical protein